MGFLMSRNRPATYRAAGVDIDEADRATGKIKKLALETFDGKVLRGVGAFGACYAFGELGLKDPVLVSSADGVGTKLNVAFSMGVHDTVGQCLVNHCVNDIAVQGAVPLFFLDYFAVGKLEAGVAAEVVKGLSQACRENGCVLIGGETAEMPGMYRPGEYDLAGFIVGAAERSALLDPGNIRPGDAVIGLPSNGLHTNGYSLARKLLFETAGYSPAKRLARLGTTVGAELLKVHRSYLKSIRALHQADLLLGAAHITGGGISDNLPRVLPPGVEARVDPGSWPALPIFELLAEIGRVEHAEMMRTFNMGVGMAFVVPGAKLARAVRALEKLGETPYPIGEIAKARRSSAKPKVVYR
jgi:phosphoribosylformylglycinamidine cyclo-ligase